MTMIDLIDPRTGIVSDLRCVSMPANLPTSLVMYDSVLSDARQFGGWEVDSTGGGCALGDDEQAAAAAVGEAIERYCGNLVPPGLLRSTARDLIASGRTVIPLDEVALYSAEQYRQPGFPFTALTDDLEMEWTTGVDVATGREVWVPASLVWVSYIGAMRERGCVHTNPIMQAGLSAGPDLDFATMSALTEIVERDTMTMAWHGRASLAWVEVADDLRSLGAGRTGRLDTRFVSMPTDCGLTVAGAIVRDRDTGYLTMGTSARPRAEPALRKAFAEACQLHRFVADYDDPSGPYMRAAADPWSPLMPWRSDRRYLDDYGSDFTRVRDYGCHLQLYLDTRMQDLFVDELSVACAETVTPADLDAQNAASVIDGPGALAERLVDTGSTVVRCDLTTADIADTGVRVVRMIATGRYSNSPVGLPFLGGTRLAAQLAANRTTRRLIPLPH